MMNTLMLFFLLATVAHASVRNAFLSIDQMTVNGHAVALEKMEPMLSLEPRVEQIRWKVRVFSGAKRQGLRIQFRLTGVDAQWREFKGPMSINLRWLDAKGSLMDIQSYYPEGESPGWTSTWEEAPMIEHVERVTVPANSGNLEFQLVSGISAILGSLLLDDLRVTLEETGELLYACDFNAVNPMHQGWFAGGLRKEMSKWVSRVEQGKTNGMLAIFDDSVIGYSDWRKRMLFDPKKFEGKVLRVQWRMMNDIGSCITSDLEYDRLAPGQYAFEVRAVHPLTREPVPQTTIRVPFVIPVVLWKQTWFISCCIVAVSLVLGCGVLVVQRTRWRRRLERSERQRLVEAEKTRIARDLHDDLGAGLTQMAIYSELALQQRQDPDKLTARLDDVFTTAQRLARSLNEIVWAVNPGNDTVESLVAYLGEYVAEFLRSAGIALRSDVPLSIPPRPIASSTRHHLFCCSREILNNVVRHAEATEVLFRITFEENVLAILFADNGKGFSKDGVQKLSSSHNGLRHLQQRMQEAGGTCTVDSEVGKGTSITLKVSLFYDHSGIG